MDEKRRWERDMVRVGGDCSRGEKGVVSQAAQGIYQKRKAEPLNGRSVWTSWDCLLCVDSDALGSSSRLSFSGRRVVWTMPSHLPQPLFRMPDE